VGTAAVRNSKIQWTDHTFNPWWGCTNVSPGCVRCYAHTLAKRTGWDVWGATTNRRFFGDAHWSEPLRWNEAAETEATRARVFCGSMCDVFEDHSSVGEARRRLWEIIARTPALDWLLLTKRPELIAGLAPWGESWPTNVWLGTSVETQEFADRRIPLLRSVPARLRFLSCEPLLGPVDLTRWQMVDWVIVGGESGPGARPMDASWALALRDQCEAAGVPFFFKQTGVVLARQVGIGSKGGEWDDLPAEFRIRQFPTAPAARGAA
jgi:protein gp37